MPRQESITLLFYSVIIVSMSSWTLAELVEIATRALAADDVRVVSGRVAEVPNERLVRWYSTIGLVDRPTIGRGRAARYGERQLAQLVAVKRLQAQGLPLVEIQQRLLEATDAELRLLAGLPDDVTVRTPAAAGAPGPSGPVHRLSDQAPVSVDSLSDGQVPGVRSVREATNGVVGQTESRFWERRPARPSTSPAPVFGLTVSGLTLLLPAQPSPADVDAIAAATVPLIELLASRGLLDPPKGSQP